MRKTSAFITIMIFSLFIPVMLGACSGSSESKEASNAVPQAEENVSDNAEDTQDTGNTQDTGDTQDAGDTQDTVNTQNAQDKEEKKPEEAKEAGESLAQKMCGKYSYNIPGNNGENEYLIMNVVSFGDNLYAYCGQAMGEDTESLSAYSYWASEFIPADEKQMKSTEDLTVNVTELRFSVMSHAGKYWDGGCPGTITYTEDGLVFEGFKGDEFLCPDDDSRLFLKDDRCEDVFTYIKEKGDDQPGEAAGLWYCSKTGTYVDFRESGLYIYRKAPDEEVYFAAGGCEYSDGSFTCVASRLGYGQMPVEISAEYTIKGDDLAISFDGDLPSEMLGEHTFSRKKAEEIKVFTEDEIEIAKDTDENEDIVLADEFYGVFIASFKTQDECRKTEQKLEEKGFCSCPVIYTPDFSDLNPEPYYTVTAGLFTSKEEAEKVLKDVKTSGFGDAYVKYAGSYIGGRNFYTASGGNETEVLDDCIILHDVSVSIPYMTYANAVVTDLYVYKDAVFDSSAQLEFFGNYEKGDTPYTWIKRNKDLMSSDPDKYMENGPALAGVFEVGLEGKKIKTYYGSYWWD